jgi:hypothetical protein
MAAFAGPGSSKTLNWFPRHSAQPRRWCGPRGDGRPSSLIWVSNLLGAQQGHAQGGKFAWRILKEDHCGRLCVVVAGHLLRSAASWTANPACDRNLLERPNFADQEAPELAAIYRSPVIGSRFHLMSNQMPFQIASGREARHSAITNFPGRPQLEHDSRFCELNLSHVKI